MGDRVKKKGLILSVDRNELKDRQTGKTSYYVKFVVGFITDTTRDHAGLDIQEFTGSENMYDVLVKNYGPEIDLVVEYGETYDSRIQKRIPKKRIVQVDDVEIA